MPSTAKEVTTIERDPVDYQYELLRKGIHLCSLSIPVVYFFISRELTLSILIPMTVLFVVADLLRSFHPPTFALYRRIFGKMLRTHEQTLEKKTLNGATWVLISATFCVFVFPKLITITAFSILIISDTVAALVGRRFGTRRYRGKSLEGSTAFVISAALVVLLTPKVAHLPGEYLIGIVAGVVGAVAEVLSFGIIDDNFAIPVSIGATLWLLYALALPALNVYILDLL